MGRWLDNLMKGSAPEEERFILSIDGGGIRGLVPATILAHLKEDLIALGDERPFYSHFDLIAGTSTGALLALGLGMKGVNVRRDEGEEIPVHHTEKKGLFRKAEVLDGYIERSSDPAVFTELYLNNAKKIFRPRSRIFGAVFSDKYDSASLEDFLMESFQDSILEDALVPTMVVSYDSLSGQGVVMSSYNEWKKTKTSQAARASSAAPLYFPPFYTVDPEGNEVALLDGGMIANDPGLIAYIEARKLYPNCKRFHILSLSTARNIYSFNPRESLTGLAGWAEPVMKIYPNAQMSLVHMALSEFSDVEYTRVMGAVTKTKVSMDDTRDESMHVLIEGGEMLYEEHKEALKAYLEKISKRTDWSNVRLKREERKLLEA